VPIFAICLLLLGSLVILQAEPYNGRIFNYYQPDGSSFEIRLFGDEFYAVAETLDGYVVVQDPMTKFFSYAKLAKDGNSFESTGIKAGSQIPQKLSLEKKIRISREAKNTISSTARTRFGVDQRGQILPEIRRELLPETIAPALAAAAQDNGNILLAPPSVATVGSRIGLVLLAQFPDQLQDVTVSKAEVDAYCNDPNYTEFDNATSVHGYFSIQSNGKLQYNCLVTAYFTAAHDRDYYTDSEIAFGTQAKELINEGLAVLKNNGFDFTKCDANGSGVLDGVNLFYAGERVNSWSHGLWPHKWSSSWEGLSGEGVSTSFQYQISNMGSTLALGTFCHENGHMICDFPDLYAYNGGAAVVNNYSLMSRSGDKHPVNVDPYLKIHAGWATVTDLTMTSQLRGLVKVDINNFYRYRNPDLSQEYFLLEVRDDSGYEGGYGGSTTAVNPTSGLVVYHAYELGDNTYSTIFTGDNPVDYTTPYELLIVEANPSSTNIPWYNDPAPGDDDAFHSGDVSEVSDLTVPALKFWNTASGRTENSGLQIRNISAQSDTITFTIGSVDLDTPVLGVSDTSLTPVSEYGIDASPQSFTVFNSGGGTLSYSISENISWAIVSPLSGTTTTEGDDITITYDTDGLSSGTYNGTITISDESTTNTIELIAVTLTVQAQPIISLDKSTFSKTVTAGGTGSDMFTISNTGGGTLSYTLAFSTPWLRASSTSGTVATEEDIIDVIYDATELVDGTYHGTITLTSNSKTTPTYTLEATMIVNGRHMVIIMPDGNETVLQDNRQEVIWKTDASVTGKVKIELYKDGNWENTIAASTENDSSYTWNVPAGQSLGTDYKIRVSSLDQANLFGESSTNFTIATLPTLVCMPYSEGFELSSNDWTQAIDDDFDWTRNNGGTPSSGTGPSEAQSGTYYMYTESSNPNYPFKVARLECTFDLRSSSNPQFSCFSHMVGSTMGSLLIRASRDQDNWTTLVSKSGQQFDTWVQTKVDLTPFAGQVVIIQIIGTTGSYFDGDMALDSISIIEASKILTYGTTSFYEAPGNAGAISNSLAITLAGDTFSTTAVSDGNITLSNVPAGLAALFVRDSDTQLTLSLSGNATEHSMEHSITEMQIDFADAAFTGDDALSVAGSEQLISVVFNNLYDYDQWSLSYGLVGEDAASTADIEPDGMNNLCEYALGGNPTNSDAASVLPVFDILQDDGSNWFYYVHNERIDDITLIYTVQSRTNLVSGTWQTTNVEFVGESSISDNTKSVTNRIGVDNTGFIQLQIEK
jgi:M6 family metalloprotease-like protein